jgi:transcriptional regulator with XRE-family HTH domain
MRTRSHAAALIALWRENQGMSQKAASTVLAIEQSMLSKIERGSRKPGREMAVRIQQLTGGFVPVAAWDEPEHEPRSVGASMPPTEAAS